MNVMNAPAKLQPDPMSAGGLAAARAQAASAGQHLFEVLEATTGHAPAELLTRLAAAARLPSFAMVKHDFAEKPSVLYSVLQDFRDTIEREGLGHAAAALTHGQQPQRHRRGQAMRAEGA